MAKRKNKNIFKKDFSLVSGVVIILVSSVIVVFIIAAFAGSPRCREEQKTTGVQKSKATPARETNLPDTQSWPVYTNDEYAFSFSHPPGTEVSRHMEGNGNSIDGFLIFGENGFDQSVWIRERKCSLKCFQDEIVDWWPKTKIDGKEISVGDLKGYELNFDDNGKVRREVYFRSPDGTIIYFQFDGLKSADEKLPADQENFLESFRFI